MHFIHIKQCFNSFKTDVTTYISTQQNQNQPHSIDNSDSDESTYESDNNDSNDINSLDDNLDNQNDIGVLNLLRQEEEQLLSS